MVQPRPQVSGAAGADAHAPWRGLWQGRAVLLIGLVLSGIGLRHAVTGMSPLLGGWTAALRVHAATMIPMTADGLTMARPGRWLEDRLA